MAINNSDDEFRLISDFFLETNHIEGNYRSNDIYQLNSLMNETNIFGDSTIEVGNLYFLCNMYLFSTKEIDSTSNIFMYTARNMHSTLTENVKKTISNFYNINEYLYLNQFNLECLASRYQSMSCFYNSSYISSITDIISYGHYENTASHNLNFLPLYSSHQSDFEFLSESQLFNYDFRMEMLEDEYTDGKILNSSESLKTNWMSLLIDSPKIQRSLSHFDSSLASSLSEVDLIRQKRTRKRFVLKRWKFNRNRVPSKGLRNVCHHNIKHASNIEFSTSRKLGTLRGTSLVTSIFNTSCSSVYPSYDYSLYSNYSKKLKSQSSFCRKLPHLECWSKVPFQSRYVSNHYKSAKRRKKNIHSTFYCRYKSNFDSKISSILSLSSISSCLNLSEKSGKNISASTLIDSENTNIFDEHENCLPQLSFNLTSVSSIAQSKENDFEKKLSFSSNNENLNYSHLSFKSAFTLDDDIQQKNFNFKSFSKKSLSITRAHSFNHHHQNNYTSLRSQSISFFFVSAKSDSPSQQQQQHHHQMKDSASVSAANSQVLSASLKFADRCQSALVLFRDSSFVSATYNNKEFKNLRAHSCQYPSKNISERKMNQTLISFSNYDSLLSSSLNTPVNSKMVSKSISTSFKSDFQISINNNEDEYALEHLIPTEHTVDANVLFIEGLQSRVLQKHLHDNLESNEAGEWSPIKDSEHVMDSITSQYLDTRRELDDQYFSFYIKVSKFNQFLSKNHDIKFYNNNHNLNETRFRICERFNCSPQQRLRSRRFSLPLHFKLKRKYINCRSQNSKLYNHTNHLPHTKVFPFNSKIFQESNQNLLYHTHTDNDSFSNDNFKKSITTPENDKICDSFFPLSLQNFFRFSSANHEFSAMSPSLRDKGSSNTLAINVHKISSTYSKSSLISSKFKKKQIFYFKRKLFTKFKTKSKIISRKIKKCGQKRKKIIQKSPNNLHSLFCFEQEDLRQHSTSTTLSTRMQTASSLTFPFDPSCFSPISPYIENHSSCQISDDKMLSGESILDRKFEIKNENLNEFHPFPLQNICYLNMETTSPRGSERSLDDNKQSFFSNSAPPSLCETSSLFKTLQYSSICHDLISESSNHENKRIEFHDVHCTCPINRKFNKNIFFHKIAKESMTMEHTGLNDDFDILKSLGTGGFGSVVLIRCKTTKRLFACKILEKKNFFVGKSDLRKEVLVMTLLDHPNVAKVFGTREDFNYLYVIMEYYDGVDLLSFIKRKNYEEFSILGHKKHNSQLPNHCNELTYTPEHHIVVEKIPSHQPSISNLEILHFFRQIMSAIHHVHSKGICHRDLKPENFFLEGSSIRLIDFGSSFPLRNSIYSDFLDSSDHHTCIIPPLVGHYTIPPPPSLPKTKNLSFKQSENGQHKILVDFPSSLDFPYCPPEAFENPLLVSTSADIFSAGCVMFSLAAVCEPYFGHQSDDEEDEEEYFTPEMNQDEYKNDEDATYLRQRVRQNRLKKHKLSPKFLMHCPSWQSRPEFLKKLILWMLEGEPEIRPSATDVLIELDKIMKMQHMFSHFKGHFNGLNRLLTKQNLIEDEYKNEILELSWRQINSNYNFLNGMCCSLDHSIDTNVSPSFVDNCRRNVAMYLSSQSSQLRRIFLSLIVRNNHKTKHQLFERIFHELCGVSKSKISRETLINFSRDYLPLNYYSQNNIALNFSQSTQRNLDFFEYSDFVAACLDVSELLDSSDDYSIRLSFHSFDKDFKGKFSIKDISNFFLSSSSKNGKFALNSKFNENGERERLRFAYQLTEMDQLSRELIEESGFKEEISFEEFKNLLLFGISQRQKKNQFILC